MAGINKEQWISDIAEQLFPDNSFLKKAVDHSSYAKEGDRIVHIPNAGANSTVNINPSFPLAVGTRTDTDLTYNIDWYYTSPVSVTNLEELSVNYDKRKSVMYNTMMNLNTSVANQTLVNWSNSASTKTTGATGSTAPAGSTVAKKKLTLADVGVLKYKMDTDNIPNDGNRNLVLPAAMYQDLISDPAVSANYALGYAATPSGEIPQILGFNVIIRSTTFTSNGSGAIRATTYTGSTTGDSHCALAYHTNYVSVAVGTIDVLYQSAVPAYGGDILSISVMYGSSLLRGDGKGSYTIEQG